MVRFKQKDREPFQLDLIPMINMVFLLLIFFMLTSSSIKQGLEVELPEAKTGKENSSQNLTIVVGTNGALEIEAEAVTLETLPAKISQLLETTKSKTITIKADKSIEFQQFGKVIEIAKQSGVDDFMLATEEVKSGE